jgi:hypothetical protein
MISHDLSRWGKGRIEEQWPTDCTPGYETYKFVLLFQICIIFQNVVTLRDNASLPHMEQHKHETGYQVTRQRRSTLLITQFACH